MVVDSGQSSAQLCPAHRVVVASITASGAFVSVRRLPAKTTGPSRP